MKRWIRLLFLHVLALLGRPFARRAPSAIDSVLYIKPDHLGDLLLATPVLAALRRRFPNACITALVGPWSQVVLERNPDVDSVLTCPFPGFARAAPAVGRLSGLLARVLALARPYGRLLRYALLLRAGRYSLAIIGRDDHWWGAALALLAGVPLRVGFAVPECRPFLTTALPWDPHAHVTFQGLELVEAAVHDRRGTASGTRRAPCSDGQPGAPSQPAARFMARFDPAPGDLVWARAWLEAQGVVQGERLVVIHPGTGGPAKLWFPDRWAAVAAALQADGACVLITGGPGEETLVAEVAHRMPTPPLTLAGRTTVGQLGALLRHAVLVLGVDSGPLHLAAAQGIPTLHLYGPGDAGRFGPWGDPARHVVVRAGLWCSPCGVFSACPRGLVRPACMEQIAVAQVVAQARRLLAAGAGLA
jgi:heptosyltransferase-2/heptosyltransferase-3